MKLARSLMGLGLTTFVILAALPISQASATSCKNDGTVTLLINSCVGGCENGGITVAILSCKHSDPLFIEIDHVPIERVCP